MTTSSTETGSAPPKAARRTPQQIAADAQAAYRASVAKRHAAAVADVDRCQKASRVAQANVAMWEGKTRNVQASVAALAAELAQIDRAAATLAGEGA